MVARPAAFENPIGESLRVRVVIGIVLYSMPTMLSDITKGIVADQPDMSIVGEVSHGENLVAALTSTGASFLIVGLANGSLADACTAVLYRRPDVTVLGLTSEGQQAFLYELRPHAIPVGELSPQRLVDVIRRAGGTQ